MLKTWAFPISKNVRRCLQTASFDDCFGRCRTWSFTLDLDPLDTNFDFLFWFFRRDDNACGALTLLHAIKFIVKIEPCCHTSQIFENQQNTPWTKNDHAPPHWKCPLLWFIFFSFISSSFCLCLHVVLYVVLLWCVVYCGVMCVRCVRCGVLCVCVCGADRGCDEIWVEGKWGGNSFTPAKPPGPRTPDVHISGPQRFKNTTKFHEKTPKRRKKERTLWREKEKKREILGPPAFGLHAGCGPTPLNPPCKAPFRAHHSLSHSSGEPNLQRTNLIRTAGKGTIIRLIKRVNSYEKMINWILITKRN